MQYFVLPIFLIVFFELLGQSVLIEFKRRLWKFNAVIGFSVFLALLYMIGFPIVYFKMDFNVLFVATILLFLISGLLILKNIKRIKLTFDKKSLLILLVLFAVQLFFVTRSTIGSVVRYDTIHYTQLIAGTIYGPTLNSLDFFNGYPGTLNGYVMQAYYNLAAVLYYIVNGVCNRIGVSFLYFTQHTWMYSILYYYLFGAMIVDFVDLIGVKKNWSKALIFIFLCVFMTNFYWNSEQAFLGNTYRMLLMSYAVFYVKEYMEHHNIFDLCAFALILLANAACANSNSTLALIAIFAVWLFLDGKKYELRVLAIGLYTPILNIVFTLNENLFVITFVPLTILLLMVFMFEKQLESIFNRFKIRKIFAIAVTIGLIVSSLLITKNPFDFSHFISNMSGWADMTWDYTDFSTLWSSVANVIYILIMIFWVVFEKNNPYAKPLIAATLIFFNPFAAPIQNTYMCTFYRNYDFVINYFTLIVGIKVLEEYLTKKKIYTMSLASLTLISLYPAVNQIIYHPDYNFEKRSDYNDLLRMSNEQAAAVLFVKDFLQDKDKNIKAISSVLQLRSELPTIITLYNRGKSNRGNDTPLDIELYNIFYPTDYFGDPWAPKNPQYERVCEFLGQSDYDLIIQDKNEMYHDKESDTYYSLTYLLDECGREAVYENYTYKVYWFGD